MYLGDSTTDWLFGSPSDWQGTNDWFWGSPNAPSIYSFPQGPSNYTPSGLFDYLTSPTALEPGGSITPYQQNVNTEFQSIGQTAGQVANIAGQAAASAASGTFQAFWNGLFPPNPDGSPSSLPWILGGGLLLFLMIKK